MTTSGTGYGGSSYAGFGWGGPSGGVPAHGKLKCVPVMPGSVTIRTQSGVAVTDDGQGGFAGQGQGVIDYRTGEYTVVLAGGVSGEQILADYKPQEGGCSDKGCGACKTQKIRLVLTPGQMLIGQSQLTVTDAYKRMLAKLQITIPIHVQILPFVDDDGWSVMIADRYDEVPADVQPDDTRRFQVIWT